VFSMWEELIFRYYLDVMLVPCHNGTARRKFTNEWPSDMQTSSQYSE
jgi:hypothetical protein